MEEPGYSSLYTWVTHVQYGANSRQIRGQLQVNTYTIPTVPLPHPRVTACSERMSTVGGMADHPSIDRGQWSVNKN